jgi:hypothetical protein
VRILLTKRFRSALRGWSEADLRAVGDVLNTAAATFGHPHLHQGRGIRQLLQGTYEVRAGLSRRLVFVRQGDVLIFDFAGTHAQVQAYLKNRR